MRAGGGAVQSAKRCAVRCVCGVAAAYPAGEGTVAACAHLAELNDDDVIAHLVGHSVHAILRSVSEREARRVVHGLVGAHPVRVQAEGAQPIRVHQRRRRHNERICGCGHVFS